MTWDALEHLRAARIALVTIWRYGNYAQREGVRPLIAAINSLGNAWQQDLRAAARDEADVDCDDEDAWLNGLWEKLLGPEDEQETGE